MNRLCHDRRFYLFLFANVLSSIGSGITMIAIPWLLVTQVDGGTVLGYTTIFMTIFNFVLTPWVGQIVDRYSRKQILMFGEAFGFILIMAFVIVGILGFDFQIGHYIILYGTGSLYYNFFYPAIFAFNQEVFEQSVYQSLNGAMEIQGQISSVIAGAVAAMLISTVDLHWMLLLDAITYFGAFLLYRAVPYSWKERALPKGSFWRNLTEGYWFLKKKPILFWFLMASFMPFIGVMVTNYVFPVYLADVLKTDASAYGMQSMVYGIGAAAAGMIIPFLAVKWGNRRSILVTVLIYTIGISAILLVDNIPFFFVLTVLLAFGNAGTRVARNSFMMEVVPNEIIGRVDSLFRVVGLGIRIVLLMIFTQFTASNNVLISFYLLTGLLVTSFLIVYCTEKTMKRQKEDSFSKAIHGKYH
ncbi:MFS transporter [Bacillus sp. FJAT-29790]|uniref:MFS transporter n=1 Tax=Bacillus sp. FJAT-29790 TaxID=1895002 RepID=UPI001C229307|nr:MFS transporter [Bacillus sp. FJAT-29790]MBU8880111.1 MFS transporter [Bacillus sp. FJAT-29790]